MLARKFLHLLFPLNPSVAAILLLVLWVFLTGALHLDGLADTFDGIGGGASKSDRLRIMQDPYIGTFGLVALVLLLLLKYNLLANLEGVRLTSALFYSPLLSRWSMVVLMYTTPYSRKSEGLVKPFIAQPKSYRLLLATAITLAAGIFSPHLFFFFLLPITALAITVARAFFLNKLGGITGDCLGAINELIELTVLLCLIFPFLPDSFLRFLIA